MPDPADDPSLSLPPREDIGVPGYLTDPGAMSLFIDAFSDAWEESRKSVKSQALPRATTIVLAPWPHTAHAIGLAIHGTLPKTPRLPTNEHGDTNDYFFEDPLAPHDLSKRKLLTPMEQIYTQGFQRGWTAFASSYLQMFE
jgi:hypothetical protein